MKTRTLRIVQSPSLGDKLRRALWQVVWLLLYRPTPVFLFAWRILLLRLFGARIAGSTYPYPSVHIWAPWNLTMERGSCLGARVNCYNVARVMLGPKALVSQGAYLCTASHNFASEDFELMIAEISIGENAWVTTEAYVGPGVHVGEGAIVGARAVVTKDVPAQEIVAGNPARTVGTRH